MGSRGGEAEGQAAIASQGITERLKVLVSQAVSGPSELGQSGTEDVTEQ
jgi:hypothetical protein